MKKTHQATPDPKALAAQSATRDKRRMLIMAFALVVLVIGYFYSESKGNEYEQNAQLGLPGTPEDQVAYVQLPEIDAEAIDALVSDTTEEARVLLEREAVDLLYPIARNLTDAHFEELNATELDEARVAELLANPSAARGQAFTARGWLGPTRLRKPGGGRPNEVHGLVVLEDYTPVYFIVAEDSSFTKPFQETDFVRLDGLFLKAFNDEDAENPGEWIQGPLLVGPGLQRSYRNLGEVTRLPLDTFVDVQDDDLREGITGIPHSALWTLLAFARDRDLESFDWEGIPELTNEVAIEMLQDGSEWRGRAFRMPVLKVLAIWERTPGENPARMDKVTEGWIGSWTWTGEAKVLRFAMPGDQHGIREGDEITGSGVFLKNYAYEPGKGGMRVSSMVVLDTLEKFDRPVDTSMDTMWAFVMGGTGIMVALLVYLVTRDRKRANELQEKLVARRRARRNLLSQAKPLGDASTS